MAFQFFTGNYGSCLAVRGAKAGAVRPGQVGDGLGVRNQGDFELGAGLHQAEEGVAAVAALIATGAA